MTQTSRYDRRPFLARAYAFHFSPMAGSHQRNLTNNNPDEVTEAVLQRLQKGDFDQFQRLISLMKKYDHASVWGDASMLFSYAAPASEHLLLLDAFSDEIFKKKDPVVQQWIAETMLGSGLLNLVPKVLEILKAQTKRDTYFSIPTYLSYVLEPERTEVFDGPDEIPDPGPWPEWFEAPFTYDDESYCRMIATRCRDIGHDMDTPLKEAAFEGLPLNLQKVAERMLERIAEKQDVEEIAIARLILEANTGQDMSMSYRDVRLDRLGAAAAVQILLDDVDLASFRVGQRYFFGHEIPE